MIFLTYYEILNVKKNATDKEIKNAYRALAKKYHPDTYKGNKSVAEEKMKQINEAYDILSNLESKAKYDEQFSSPIEENVKRDSYNKSYYNYQTNEYKSPDPREADYRTYYNYSADYEYEPDYDWSKLFDLFKGSKIKVIFAVIGIIAILVFIVNMVNELKRQALAILEYDTPVIEYEPIENIPAYNYKIEETTPKTPANNVQSNIDFSVPEVKAEDIDKQIKEWEESFNKWYETDGKQYEEKLKNELNSLYQSFKEEASKNNN